MGLLDSIIPTVIGAVTGGPVGASAAFIGSQRQQRETKRQKALIEERRQQEKRFMEFDIRGSNQRLGGNFYGSPQQSTQAGFGSGFGSFLTDVGSNILSPISNLFSQVRPFISQQSVGQPALPTRTNLGGQESQSSGVTEGFVGGIPNVLGQAARFLRTPGGQIGTGLIGGIGASLLGGPSDKIRITRKMKSQYRAVLNLAQGDYDQAAGMIGVSTDFFIMVLLKRFRNDGPVVTKAALRKTKTTVRRLKSMCDMYDSLRPTATRRKAPMRRASTTLISNK
jgi:gas vesicle protein